MSDEIESWNYQCFVASTRDSFYGTYSSDPEKWQEIDCEKFGERDAYWIMRTNSGAFQEGAIVSGKRNGHWIVRYSYTSCEPDCWREEGFVEGTYVDGVKHGRWIEKGGHSSEYKGERFFLTSWEEEGAYVNDKRDGRWVTRNSDGDIWDEGSYVNGERHGHWIDHNGNEDIEYFHGEVISRKKRK